MFTVGKLKIYITHIGKKRVSMGMGYIYFSNVSY